MTVAQTANLRNHEVDNRWIVPYNPLLRKAFNAHISVKLYSSIKSIQYVIKCINKRSREISVRSLYLQLWSSIENVVIWNTQPSTYHYHLDVNLENGQRVFFNPNNINDVVANPRDTSMTAFFELCSKDDLAKTLTYDKIPNYYTWNQSAKTNQRRKYGTPIE